MMRALNLTESAEAGVRVGWTAGALLPSELYRKLNYIDLQMILVA